MVQTGMAHSHVVDHFSWLRYIHFHTSLTSEETIQAKMAFEKFAARHGVKIQQYHADNGRFADNAFISHCEDNKQLLTYCGVNAHFQNGIAERAIRDIQEQARKSLLHAINRWPKVMDLSLWPYATRYAVFLHNVLPSQEDGRSRLEVFGNFSVGHRLSDCHTFGCPVYALQNALQGGSTVPKWSPRARLGVNLGPSPFHACNVYLILNPTTGLVSPQFHVSFDDFFETILYQDWDTSVDPTWKVLAGLESSSGGKSGRILQTPLSTGAAKQNSDDVISDGQLNQDPPNPTSVMETPNFEATSVPDDDHVSLATIGDPSDVLDHEHQVPVQRRHQPLSVQILHDQTEGGAERNFGTSSRGRQRTMSRRMQDATAQGLIQNFNQAMLSTAPRDQPILLGNDFDVRHDYELAIQERMRHPIAFHAEMMGDIMYLHQALKQDDSAEFIKAVVKEVNDHTTQKHWKVIERSKVPEGVTPLPSVWAMRRKHNLTTNEITKYKARLNVHGGKQEFGVNYYETYAPVVTWFAIRLMIVFAIIFGWALRQVNFVLAYTQAPIEVDMYM